MSYKTRLRTLLLITTSLLVTDVAHSCSRALYQGPNDRVLTGRNMDWKLEWDGNLWIMPRGIDRHGEAGARSAKWTSKYGSLVVSGYELATVDGLNEKGLMANALWLSGTEYAKDDGKTPRISLAIWAQYVLDNFASVAEAVEYFNNNPLHIVGGDVPGEPGRLASLHLSLSDKSGDSAIFEWIKGEMQIHHDRKYQVMTNEPEFKDQLAIQKYWTKVDGLTFLPGSSRAEDRFARASFLINAVDQVDDARLATAAVLSVMRNVSAPYGVSMENQPNLSTTRWRVVADHKAMLYYFESVVSPNIFWVDLKKVDFSNKKGVRKLDLGKRQENIFSGEVSKKFVKAKPFPFLAVE